MEHKTKQISGEYLLLHLNCNPNWKLDKIESEVAKDALFICTNASTVRNVKLVVAIEFNRPFLKYSQNGMNFGFWTSSVKWNWKRKLSKVARFDPERKDSKFYAILRESSCVSFESRRLRSLVLKCYFAISMLISIISFIQLMQNRRLSLGTPQHRNRRRVPQP